MNKRITALLVAILLTAVFIFAHSALSPASSLAESSTVGSALTPILGRLHAGVVSLFSGVGVDLSATLPYERFVRRLAHLFEFGLFGAECAAVVVLLTRSIRSPYLWTCLFAVLSAAVVDEFIQLLSGRTSSVADVLWDFCGGCFGIAIALAVAAVVMAISARRVVSGNTDKVNRLGRHTKP